MKLAPLVYALSAIAIALGLLLLLSEASSPSLDPIIFARDVVAGVLAVVLGALAPALTKKFSQ
jgi:ABC-type Fe3+ transport system permease subunit